MIRDAWRQYLRTAPYIQVLIFGIAAWLWFARVLPAEVIVCFAIMEVAAVLGAVWAVRLKRKLAATPPRR